MSCLSSFYSLWVLVGLTPNDWYLFFDPDTYQNHHKIQNAFLTLLIYIIGFYFMYFMYSSMIYCAIRLDDIFAIVSGLLLVYFLSFPTHHDSYLFPWDLEIISGMVILYRSILTIYNLKENKDMKNMYF